MFSGISIAEKLISMLDKIGITRCPDDPNWQWDGKAEFPSSYIIKLAELHGGNDEEIRKHT